MTSDKVDTSTTHLASFSASAIPHRPRIFILSDTRLLREGVSAALAEQPSVEVVGSSDLSAQPRGIAALAPDALLLDITVQGNLKLSLPIRDAIPRAKVVCLGVVEIEPVVMACARAGVSGFVAPNGSVSDVLAAVHSAVRGELICSPRTAGILLNRVSALAVSRLVDESSDALTQREREISRFVGEGLSNKQIGAALGIQSATVKNHVHSILGKLKMRRRIEIAAFSRRQTTHSPDRISENHRPGDPAMVHDRAAMDVDRTA